MTDRPTKEKPDTGYNGSNMHGYSITKKGEALDQTANAATCLSHRRICFL